MTLKRTTGVLPIGRTPSLILICWALMVFANIATGDIAAMHVGSENRRGIDISQSGSVLSEYKSIGGGWGCEAVLYHSPPFPSGGSLFSCVDPGCFHESPVPIGFGANGQVVGSVFVFGSGICLGPGGAAVWDSGPVKILSGGAESAYSLTAVGVNASGRIVGIASVDGRVGPVTWSDPEANAVALPVPNPQSNYVDFVMAINNANAVVGTLSLGNPNSVAVIWLDGGGVYAITVLGGLPGGSSSEARDLNESGIVVGQADDGVIDRAVFWRLVEGSYVVEALPSPFEGGSCRVATGISNSDWIVGECTPAGGDPSGVAWKLNGATIDYVVKLAPLAGDIESDAQAVNDAGIATGSSGTNPERPVVWQLSPPASNVPALRSPWALVAGLTMTGLALLRGLARASTPVASTLRNSVDAHPSTPVERPTHSPARGD